MNVISEIQSTIKNWWVYTLLGVLFILTSFYIFTESESSYLTLAFVFAMIMVFDGFGSIMLAFVNRKVLEGWGWQLASGVLSVVLGFILLIHPGLTMAILPLFVGFWVILKGSLIIGSSLDLKKMGVQGWGFVLVLGIFNALFGTLMVMNPLFGANVIILFTGLSFLMSGIALIALSLRLRGFKQKINEIKEGASDKLQEVKASVEAYMKEQPEDVQGAFKELKSKLDSIN